MQDTAIFQSHLVEPFTSLLGEPLRDVEYWVMKTNAGDFQAEQPNIFGVQVIHLRFGAVSLAITWGGEKQLLGEAMHYHIQVMKADQGNGFGPGWAENFRGEAVSPIPALSAAPWWEVVGEPLSGVEIIGSSDTPQAIRLLFPHTSLILVVGYPGDYLLLGDSDRLLVFSDADWEQLKHKDYWKRLWLASATS